MALHDEEQRQLAEIERRLTEDDPRLAERLARLRPAGVAKTVLVICGVMVSFVLGLTAIAVGAELASVVLGIAGAAFAVVFPTVLVWRLWVRKLH